ncbi:MAG TPA: SRPBCC domain-containing protein [Galbitalea sp.]
MAVNELLFSREYDLPTVIVWDALVDEVLVDGWLAAAKIDARHGGSYSLNWQSGTTLAPTNGTITVFEPPMRLVIETDNIGDLDFSLVELQGGTRGTSTVLTLLLRVDTDIRLLGSTTAYWQSNFDQLEELLRGHPVDWDNWQRDRGEVWAEYFRTSSDGS